MILNADYYSCSFLFSCWCNISLACYKDYCGDPEDTPASHYCIASSRTGKTLKTWYSDIVYTCRWMDLTYSPGRTMFRDTMAIFKNLSSLCPCGVCLSVAPPAQSQFFLCWSQGCAFVLVQSLCFSQLEGQISPFKFWVFSCLLNLDNGPNIPKATETAKTCQARAAVSVLWL